MRTEPAKHILQSVKDFDEFFPRDYNMNLYRGCCHGCIYCDGRSSCYHVEDFSSVRVKENALQILESELRLKRKRGIVGLGGMSDGYNAFEKTELVTRGALNLLREYSFGIGVTTKSALAARDIDLFRDIRENSVAHVTFSITTDSDETSKKIEPNVSKTSERFEALKEISSAGIPAGVWINPMLPYITDDIDGMTSLLERTKAAGGKYAICFFEMTLREGNREYFYQALDKEYPGLKLKYAQDYGNSYVIRVPNADALERRFSETCEKLGLVYSFKKVHDMLSESGCHKQLSFL